MNQKISTGLGTIIIVIFALTAVMFIWGANKKCQFPEDQQIWMMNKKISKDHKACTQEAKVCPDGSAVGRTGENCEFAPCPNEAADCTKEGESIGAVYPGVKPKKCCEGLTPVIPQGIVGTQGICQKANPAK